MKKRKRLKEKKPQVFFETRYIPWISWRNGNAPILECASSQNIIIFSFERNSFKRYGIYKFPWIIVTNKVFD